MGSSTIDGHTHIPSGSDVEVVQSGIDFASRPHRHLTLATDIRQRKDVRRMKHQNEN